MNKYHDGYTKWLNDKMDEWLSVVYDMDENFRALMGNEEGIIKYLNDVRCSLPIGLAIRRYIGEKFCDHDELSDKYIYVSGDGEKIVLSNYVSEDYNIAETDVNEFTKIFLEVNAKYNSAEDGSLILPLTKVEARRLIKSETVCRRKKMFQISFALHMNAEDTHYFLTRVLAEQTYSMRSPEEVIAYFCQSHEDMNSYAKYLELCEKYGDMTVDAKADRERNKYFTKFAKGYVESKIETEEELLRFLAENKSDFKGFSETAHEMFMELYNVALQYNSIQPVSNDEHIIPSEAKTIEQWKQREARLENSIGLRPSENSERLAKSLVTFIPRAGTTSVIKGKRVTTNDFIPINNGEAGQKGIAETTTLPLEITKCLLVADRLENLKCGRAQVQKKDLVLLKFYNLYHESQVDRAYTSHDQTRFMDECNGMLEICGMSTLYPANRFDNLILMSLCSTNPFETFEAILSEAFINEPGIENEKTSE